VHRLLGLVGDGCDPWRSSPGWRPSGAAETAWTVAGPRGEPLRVAVTGSPGAARVRVGDAQPRAVRAERVGDALLVTADGRTTTVLVAEDGATTWLHVDGAAYAVQELPPERRGAGAASHAGDLRSPMPGTVLAVRVAEGERVEEGDVLLVVEAMKMEHALAAPHAGTVADLQVRTGDQVVVDQLLATVVPVAAEQQ
jgi:acetyl-CoA/propionyl-CoA carboxylase biotin carboxyl carrier protein